MPDEQGGYFYSTVHAISRFLPPCYLVQESELMPGDAKSPSLI
jgi:hypothetical protein